MAQQIKLFATKSINLTLIFRSYMVQGENQLLQTVL